MNGARGGSLARPLYFPSGGATLFGWLHLPSGGAPTDVGVVICNPFGYDAVCAHRSLRAFAEAGAAVGSAVLRFDYAGTGDSADGDPDADQIAQWSADILAAAEILRRECGVKRICLLGLRCGALLAALAAARSGSISALLAIAPVINGRRYLRELRTFQAAAVLEAPAPQAGGHLEVTGFRLSAASVTRLATIDLMDLQAPPARNLCIIDRTDLPGAKPWSERMLALGGEVHLESLPGFADMMSTPHAARVPEAMIGAAMRWLHALQQKRPGDLLAGDIPAAPEPAAACMTLTGDGGRVLSERALHVDEEQVLFAILTAPQDAAPVRRGVVLLNAGATNHIGPNRMYVSLARRWAAAGYAVLRLDLAGLGDSATRPGEPDNLVYPPAALDDIAAAVEFLRRHQAVEDIALAGLCAGAYHALRAAAAGLPVTLALMINPLTFYWKQGMTLSDLQIAEIVRNPTVYRERVRSGAAWRKLLRGRVNLWRIALVYVGRAMLTASTRARDLGRRLRIYFPGDLGRDLQSIAARGVRLVFVFARGDTGAELLRIQGGAAVDELGDQCRVYTLDGADHIFSQSDSRARLERLLGRELTA